MNNLFDIKKAYYLFLLIRRSEEKIIELYNTDKIKSPVHLSIGQEAIAVGVSLALSESDIIFSNYRGHAHFIAREANLDKMWAELYGKSRGTARGKGGSMHLNDYEKNFIPTSAIVSTAVPEAVGYAFALKYKKQEGVVVCYHGDGATDEGVFWESLNFASLHSLPIIFICENNKYAIYSHQNTRSLNNPIVDRAKAFGVSSIRISDNKTKNFFDATSDCIKQIKKKSQPFLLECMTTRWRDHVGITIPELSKAEFEEIENAKNNDDLVELEKQLPEDDVLTINKKVTTEIENAINFAESSNFPEESELYDNVLA